MAALRIKEDHIFADVVNRWRLLSACEKFKLFNKGREVLKLIYVCFLLENCYICINGNSAAKVFKINPPILDQYFSMFQEEHK
jgi:hypothetical protein